MSFLTRAEFTKGSTRLRQISEALSHPSRLKLFAALLQYELSVEEMSDLVEVSTSELSDHLEVLESAGLICRDSRKSWTFYEACPNPYEEACRIILDKGIDFWHTLHRQILSAKKTELSSFRNQATTSSDQGYVA